MRPTKLNFRSPKERTGEIEHPEITCDGTRLGLLRRIRLRELRSPMENKKYTTFSNERRFKLAQVGDIIIIYIKNH